MIKFSNTTLIFWAILLLGAFLRFYGLDSQSLWNDELSSWHRSNFEHLTDVIQNSILTDVHPPGYQILLFFTKKYFGDSEFLLRLPSAIAGTLSIPFIYLIGKQLYTKQEGLIASALMAVSWYPIHYSQEARSYGLLLLFTLISTYYWLMLLYSLENESKPRCYQTTGYTITAILTCYLHYFGLLLVATQALLLILHVIYRYHSRKQRVISVVIPCLLIAAAYLPWLPAFWYRLNSGPIWIKQPTYTIILDYLIFCFNNTRAILIFILPFYLFYLGYGINELRKNRHCFKFNFNLLNPTLFLLLWLAVPFTLAYLKS